MQIVIISRKNISIKKYIAYSKRFVQLRAYLTHWERKRNEPTIGCETRTSNKPMWENILDIGNDVIDLAKVKPYPKKLLNAVLTILKYRNIE